MFLILHPHMTFKCPLKSLSNQGFELCSLGHQCGALATLAAKARQGTTTYTVQLGLVRRDFHYYLRLS